MRNGLRDLMQTELISLAHPPLQNKDEAFSFLAEIFWKNGIIKDKKIYTEALYAREKLGSTYIGKGIAVPHAKCSEVKNSAIVFCRCTAPFYYESGQESDEVRYIFGLAIETEQGGEEYIELLAELMACLIKEECRVLLEKAASKDEIIEGFEKIRSRR